jgi:signal transduction histidine kinase
MTHPVLLGEVLNVLIDNAFRYSPPGSPVVVSLARSGSTAHIEVADAGQGIAAADQPQVFTPFFRTTDGLRANKHGIGLGLSIAQRLLQALGGDLRLISQAGEGSRFIVILPATTE